MYSSSVIEYFELTSKPDEFVTDRLPPASDIALCKYPFKIRAISPLFSAATLSPSAVANIAVTTSLIIGYF